MKKLLLITSFISMITYSNGNKNEEINKLDIKLNKVTQTQSKTNNTVKKSTLDSQKKELLKQFVEFQNAVKKNDIKKIDKFISPNITIKFFPGLPEDNRQGKNSFYDYMGEDDELLNYMKLLKVSSNKLSISDVNAHFIGSTEESGDSFIDISAEFLDGDMPNDYFDDFEKIKKGSLYITERIYDDETPGGTFSFAFEIVNGKLQLTRMHVIAP